jgi:hypothetical protein
MSCIARPWRIDVKRCVSGPRGPEGAKHFQDFDAARRRRSVPENVRLSPPSSGAVRAGLYPFLNLNSMESPIGPNSERGYFAPLEELIDSRRMNLQKLGHFFYR